MIAVFRISRGESALISTVASVLPGSNEKDRVVSFLRVTLRLSGSNPTKDALKVYLPAPNVKEKNPYSFVVAVAFAFSMITEAPFKVSPDVASLIVPLMVNCWANVKLKKSKLNRKVEMALFIFSGVIS